MKKQREVSVGERIRLFRKRKGYSMEELGALIGVSRQTVFRYENGAIENIPREKLRRLSAVLDVDEATLLGFDSPPAYDGVLPVGDRFVPMLGDIACGVPVYADEDHGTYHYAGGGIDVSFCLRAKGDSMTGAHIHDGDIVFVHAQESVDNGEIAAVIIHDEATLKRVYYYPETQKLVLMPENPAYEPLVYIGAELDGIKIIGRAVALQSAIK